MMLSMDSSAERVSRLLSRRPRVGESRGDFVAIVDGLKPGQEVVTAGAFKLRNGSPVVIDNRVKPDAKLNPRPENR